MTQKHTPLPWRIRYHPTDPDEFHVSAITPESHPYFGRTTEIEILSDEGYPTKQGDADFIVRAVNVHEELLAALEGLYAEAPKSPQDLGALVDPITYGVALGKARAAIAKAQEV